MYEKILNELVEKHKEREALASGEIELYREEKAESIDELVAFMDETYDDILYNTVKAAFLFGLSMSD